MQKGDKMKIDQPSATSGLTTDRAYISQAGIYSITTRTTANVPSGLVMTIVQSGSQSKTLMSSTTSPIQTHIEVTGQFNCAVGDIITATVSSSAPIDQPPNLIKTVTNLRQGL